MSDEDRYAPKYVRLDDRQFREIVENALNKELTKTHYVTNVVQLQNGDRLIVLEFSLMKDMELHR
jgi:hypothetical protein